MVMKPLQRLMDPTKQQGREVHLLPLPRKTSPTESGGHTVGQAAMSTDRRGRTGGASWWWSENPNYAKG